MKKLLEQLKTIPFELKPVNRWIENPKYNKDKGETKSHLYDPYMVKMIKLDDVIKLIEDYNTKENPIN